jgi:hypothetical protein
MGETFMMMPLLALVLALAPDTPSQANELVAAKVSKLPTIDGKSDDEAWKHAKELVAKFDNPDEENPKKTISLKAVHDGDSICLLVVWSDPDKSDQHQPFVWKDTGTYEVDEEKLEDRCALAFALEGKFDSDMKAGVVSKWDVWEWGAARTNSTGFAHRIVHIFGETRLAPPIKSRQLTTRDGGKIYFSRMEAEGTPCFKKIEAPATKGAPLVNQYPTQAPTGAQADVQAKGEWAGGKWTVEFKRKLNTGKKDSPVLAVGKSIEFAVATFDHSEGSDHDVSKNITLKIAP